MNIIQAIVLGAVQGLTEFLPISSSGHLILVPYFFDWDPQTLTFDLALHVGTLMAVALYFARDWLIMFSSVIRDTRRGLGNHISKETRLFFLLALGSIPAAIAGVFLSDAEDTLRKPVLVAAMLVLIAGVMWVAERLASQRQHLDAMTPRNALATGMAQALALIPGTSRSGITISAGLIQGFDRESATRFSFLLSTPVIFGAALFNFLTASSEESDAFDLGPFLVGSVTAAIVGLFAIHLLLRYIRFNTLRVFIWYRIALAAVVLIVAAVR